MRAPRVAALLLFLTSCALVSRDADGAWRFEQGTVDGATIRPHVESPVVLEVSSGAITGTAGCNDYGIEADVYAGAFTLYEDRQITERACADAVMEAEEAYWAALQRTTIYRIEGDTLELEGDDVYLTFRRAS